MEWFDALFATKIGFFGLLFSGIGVAILWARLEEKKSWNGGICATTGEPWEQFDTNSQGGRGYVSKGHYTWISYNVDR